MHANQIKPIIMIFSLDRPVNFLAIYIMGISLCSFSLFVSTVLAHGDGASFEKEVGNYSIDIGYDPENPEAGEPARFDFKLFDKSSGAVVAFSDVWVRIEKEKNTVFATGIHNPEFGKAGLLYSFPEAGTYTIFARFENGDKTIVETSFDLDVINSSVVTGTPPFEQPLIWGILGIMIGLFLSRVKRRNV